MNKMTALFLLLVSIAGQPASKPAIQEDAVVLQSPADGDLRGRILPAKRAVSLDAISRQTGRVYRPDAFDRQSGQFEFRSLPGDAAYDLRIETGEGRRLEGIDLEFVDSRLLRMAVKRRAQLSLPAQSARPFTGEDAEELIRYVRDMKDFMEVRRPLYVRGRGPRATMLVELVRTRKFHASKEAEVIWRVELWYFRRYSGGWQREANVERVVERRRLPLDQWRKIDVEYFPQLSLRVDESGNSQPLTFSIPVKSDPSRGRVSGTSVRLNTQVHILSPAVAPAPTTQPATLPPATVRRVGQPARSDPVPPAR